MAADSRLELLPDEWNERFVMGGGGLFVGSIQNQARASINDGYVTVGTDTGHESENVFQAGWAHLDLEAQLNFGYLAVHRTAEVARALIRLYYDRDARYSYFVGCSTGGRQGLMESQRYPNDFDGIVSGCPVASKTGLYATFIGYVQTFFPQSRTTDEPLLTEQQVKNFHDQVMIQCDGNDGLNDGIINHPIACNLQWDKITGLNREQVEALRQTTDATIDGESTTVSYIVQRDVEYGRAEDRSLKLDTIRPREPDRQPLPVIVWVHGGAWRNGDKSSGHKLLVPFAASGHYFCVTVGYRLSREAIWPAQIHDCKAAIRWLKANAKQLNIDPSKIGVWGSPSGGHLVCMLGTTGNVTDFEGSCGSSDQTSDVACVVNFCGTSDVFAQAEAAPSQNKLLENQPVSPFTALFGAPISAMRDVVRQASPITHVSPGDPPFLNVHGTNDRVVPFAQSETLHKALAKVKSESTLLRIKNGEHRIVGGEALDRVRAFFDKHLRMQNVIVSSEPIHLSFPTEVREVLDLMEGEWRAILTMGARVTKGVYSWHWGVDGMCLVGKRSYSENEADMVTILGWDPVNKHLVERGFGKWGMYETRFTDLSSRLWKGCSTSANTLGAETSSAIVLRVLSDNALTISFGATGSHKVELQRIEE